MTVVDQRKGLFAAIALALLILVPLIVLLRLTVNNAPYVYLPADAPSVILDDALRKEFPNDQVLIALFERDDIYGDEALRALDGLARRLERSPLVERVLSVTRTDRIEGTEDGFEVSPLIDVGRLAESTPDQRRERVLSDRFAPRALASPDGRALAIVVRPYPLSESTQRVALERAFREAVAAEGLEGRLTAVAGHIALDVAEIGSMLRDNATFVPFTGIVGIALLWWTVRHKLAVMLGALAVMATIAVAVSCYVIADQPYTLISIMTAPLLTALTIALLLHFYNAMMLAAKRGLEGTAQVQRAVADVRKPALFNVLTTAAGLASLGFSPIPPISTFGLISAVGVLVSYVVVIGLLPPILSRWSGGSWHPDRGGMIWMRRLTEVLAQPGIRHPGWVAGGFLVLLAVGAPLIWTIKAETNFLEFFAPEHPITRSTARIDQKLTGVTPLQIVLDAPARDALKDPARLRAVKAVQDWAVTLPEVDRAFSLADFIEEMHWAFNEQDPTYRTIPESQPLVSQYLFIYDGRDLYDFVNRDFQRTLITLSLNVHGAREISRVMDGIRARLAQMDLAGLQFDIAGEGRLFADQEELLIRGQVNSLWGAMLIIFALLAIAWRSVGAGLLCMIPNAAPIALMFMVMGAAGIWLNMATAMIASVAIGIAVDDTIHVYHGYDKRRRRGLRPSWALARTYHEAGRAVVATTVILSAQFAVLIFSSFQPTVEFGLLTAVGLITALLFDLLFLPAVLMIVHRFRRAAV